MWFTLTLSSVAGAQSFVIEEFTPCSIEFEPIALVRTVPEVIAVKTKTPSEAGLSILPYALYFTLSKRPTVQALELTMDQGVAFDVELKLQSTAAVLGKFNTPTMGNLSTTGQVVLLSNGALTGTSVGVPFDLVISRGSFPYGWRTAGVEPVELEWQW
jgi:uncharacterized membrane protein